MFDRPESSLTKIRRSLPTDSGRDVFVTVGDPGDGVNVHAAFVRERALADERLIATVIHVGHVVDIARKFRQPLCTAIGQHLKARFFHGQVRANGNQIGIAAALADAVDRALHLHRAGIDGRQRIGHGQIAIVVAVNSHRHGQGGLSGFRERGDFLRHGAAVGVAQHDEACAGFRGGPHGFRGIFGIEFPAVEEMFGVVNHFPAAFAEVSDGVADHRQVFLERNTQHFGRMERRGFADDRQGFGAGIEQRFHAGVLRGLHSLAAGHAEGANPSVLQIQLLHALKELSVLFVRQRITPFDEIAAQLIEPLGDQQFILQRKIHPFALAAVTKRGVVDLDVHGWVAGGLVSGGLVSGGFEHTGTRHPDTRHLFILYPTKNPAAGVPTAGLSWCFAFWRCPYGRTSGIIIVPITARSANRRRKRASIVIGKYIIDLRTIGFTIVGRGSNTNRPCLNHSFDSRCCQRDSNRRQIRRPLDDFDEITPIYEPGPHRSSRASPSQLTRRSTVREPQEAIRRRGTRRFPGRLPGPSAWRRQPGPLCQDR